MEKIINALTTKLSIDKNELLTKLGIKETSSLSDFAKAIGAYSIFETKEKQSEYIKDKVSNKTKELQDIEAKNRELETKISEIENNSKTQEENYKKMNENINNIVKSTWEKLGVSRAFEKSNVDITKLDFNNLNKSILSLAEQEGFAVKNKNEDNNSTSEKYIPEGATVLENGIVYKK